MATAAVASSSTESSEWDWQKRLDQLQKRFDAYKTGPQRDTDEEDYDGDGNEGGGTPWQILQGACAVANKAQMTEHPDALQILERVQELSNTVVKVATKKQLGYAGLKSFADEPGTLVKDSMHSFMGHADGKLHVCLQDVPTDSRRAHTGDRLAKAMSGFLGNLLGRPPCMHAYTLCFTSVLTSSCSPSGRTYSHALDEKPAASRGVYASFALPRQS